MLYMISYNLTGDESDYFKFFDEIDKMGENHMVYDGLYLLNTSIPALGIRNRLLPHISTRDRFIVAKLFREQCAGKMDDRTKQIMTKEMSENPFPKQEPFPYSF